MWALVIVAAVGGATALVRYFRVRDQAPPMARHSRALDVLRDLSENPPPVPDVAVQPEASTEHVRVLKEEGSTAGPRPVRDGPGSRLPSRADRASVRVTRPDTPDPGRVPAPPAAGEADDPGIRDPGIRDPGIGDPVPALAFDDSSEESPQPGGRGTDLSRLSGRFGRSRRARMSSVRRRRASAAAGLGIAVVAAIAIVAGVRGSGTPSRIATTASSSSTAPRTTSTLPAPTTTVARAPVVTPNAGGATITVSSPYLLTLHATGSCWVQVNDPTGATLFAKAMQAGDDQALPGVAEIVVHLGATRAIQVSIGGVAVDTSALPATSSLDIRTA